MLFGPVSRLDPQPHLTDAQLHAGLRLLAVEGAFSSGAAALTTGVIITALALHLGASNLMIGVLASAPFLAQLLQAPAVLLVERLRTRKKIAVLSSIVGRSMLAVMGVAVFLPHPVALALVLFAQCLLCGMGALGSCAWNAWVRDLAPDDRLGQVLGRRTLYANAVALAASLAAGVALDQTAAGSPARNLAFLALYAAGCVTGLLSAGLVSRMPEPAMPPAPDRPAALGTLLREPLADKNFRRLISFLASWQFAVNLATPFFTVYLVRQLGFPMTFVVTLSVVSQIANLAALRSWGALSDRFANKSVLLVSAPAYIACIVGMIGASQLENREAIAAYLVVLHVAMGAAVGGVTLATTNIALKLSPKGSATAYVATNALVTSLAAGAAPIIGGAMADFFGDRRLELLVRWTAPEGVTLLAPLHLSHWDFYFLIAGVLGLYALHRLTSVREKGEIQRRELVAHMWGETLRTVVNLSTVAGLRAVTDVPAALLRDRRLRARFVRRAGPTSAEEPSHAYRPQ